MAVRNLVSWIVLLQLFDCIDREETHIVSDGEADVVEVVVLLVENDIVTELLCQPAHILRRSKLIVQSRLEHSWQFIVLQRHSRRVRTAIDASILNRTVIVQTESIVLSDRLRIVNHSPVGLSSWQIGHAHLKAVNVIQSWVEQVAHKIAAQVFLDQAECINGL